MRTTFQQNYTQGWEEDKEEDIYEANHLFEEDQIPIFLTKEDQFSQDYLVPSDQKVVLANDDRLEV